MYILKRANSIHLFLCRYMIYSFFPHSYLYLYLFFLEQSTIIDNGHNFFRKREKEGQKVNLRLSL